MEVATTIVAFIVIITLAITLFLLFIAFLISRGRQLVQGRGSVSLAEAIRMKVAEKKGSAPVGHSPNEKVQQAFGRALEQRGDAEKVRLDEAVRDKIERPIQSDVP
jgi:hypothetical protein